MYEQLWERKRGRVGIEVCVIERDKERVRDRQTDRRTDRKTDNHIQRETDPHRNTEIETMSIEHCSMSNLLSTDLS